MVTGCNARLYPGPADKGAGHAGTARAPDLQQAALGARRRGALRRRRSRLGHRGLRPAGRRRVQRPGGRELACPGRVRPGVRPRRRRRRGRLLQQDADGRRHGLPVRGHEHAHQAAEGTGLGHRHGRPGPDDGERRPALDVRRAAAHRLGRQVPPGHLRRDQGPAGRTRADHAPRRRRGDQRGHQRPGQDGHRPGRGHLHADPDPAADPRLRRPGRSQPAAGDRRPGDPRRLHRAAGASRSSPTCPSTPSTSSR